MRKRLMLSYNNAITNDPCGICGKRTDPIGLDIFLPDGVTLVCDECAKEYAPELFALRQVYAMTAALIGEHGTVGA